jgi:hypothetical protein
VNTGNAESILCGCNLKYLSLQLKEKQNGEIQI